MFSSKAAQLFARIFLGRRLANSESAGRKIGALEGVPAMGLDALASSAYSPEAALTVLRVAGAMGLTVFAPIMATILALLLMLYVSYRQIIQAYPNSGGAYVVAKQNLGVNAGLFAAAALMVDYVLNVAVGISTGIAALVSALPQLHPYMLQLCLAVLLLIALVNLRGTLETGRLFALPTYLFVGCFITLLAVGTVRSWFDAQFVPLVPPAATPPTAEALSAWLVLRAFASGCTAMTGIEAVSNNVNAFREPRIEQARRTLTLIVGILALLLIGIAYLVRSFGVSAMDQTQAGYQSVLSQLVAAVVGRGKFYYVAMASLLCVLALSASASFVAFPRLCRMVAEDGFLPQPFAIAGRRLVFSVGITYLALTAGALLIAFGGVTDRLIPLFAIGAFLTFTLSQAGMVAHWLRELRRDQNAATRWKHHVRLSINGIGALATGCALVVIMLAKFAEGAWLTALAIPVVVWLLRSTKRYYEAIAKQLRDEGPISLQAGEAPIVLVPTQEWNRLTDKALSFALRLSPDVLAVHFTAADGPDTQERDQALRSLWQNDVARPALAAGFKPPQLLLLQTPYRRIHTPLLKLINKILRTQPNRIIAVLIPELVKGHWWQYFLHTHRAKQLRATLLRHGGSRVIVIDVPWYLQEPQISEVLEPEELEH